MPAAKETVACRTPTPGKTAKRIAKDKFDLLRKTILRLTPKKGVGVAFTDLFELVSKELTPAERKAVGSVPWNVTTVKLELEVRGELVRVDGSNPQRLRRVM
jgi:hypothetical protein